KFLSYLNNQKIKKQSTPNIRMHPKYQSVKTFTSIKAIKERFLTVFSSTMPHKMITSTTYRSLPKPTSVNI
ncbi:MAG: hypothetical protein ACYS6K_23400, partial [Planctomycetota bacterium]